jgi:NTP pyrophosphohydrolases containing a Zn-finger, probably nucleic-acid-binding
MIQPFYASSAINRHGNYRNDEKLLNTIISEKDTKFIPFYNGKNLFSQIDDKIKPIIFNKIQLYNFLPNGIGTTIFLGVANTLKYVGIDLSSPNQKFDCWLKENNIIIDDLRKYGPILNDIEASFLALSNGMFFWHYTHKFCGSCGFQNFSTEGGFVMKCSNDKCGKSHFPRTDPAIITLISFQDKVLLGRSHRFPDSMYSTLAGFVEPGESLEQALEREVFEEVGIKVKNIEYFNSQPWPFPASLMLGFFAEAINDQMTIDYDEIEDAHWFSINELKFLHSSHLFRGGF